jgi:DNA-binding transcriptional MerR regulator
MLANSLFVALKGTHVRYKEQTLPWKLQLRIWNDGVQLKKISSSVAKQHHLSSKDAALIDLPYIVLLSKLKNYEKRIIDRLRLDESAVKVLRKETQKVSQEIRKD